MFQLQMAQIPESGPIWLYLVKNSLTALMLATGMGETEALFRYVLAPHANSGTFILLPPAIYDIVCRLYKFIYSKLLLEMDSSANAIERLIPTLISFVSRSVNFDLFCGSSDLPLFVI